MTRAILVWVPLAALLCASAGPKQAATTKPDKENLLGTWKWVSVLDQGMEMPWPEENRLVITSDFLTMVYPTEKSGWKYTIDASKRPKEMDFFPEEEPGHPIHQPAIYALEGDTLTIASAAAGKPRPTKFESKKGDFGGVWVLKRVAAPTTKEAAR